MLPVKKDQQPYYCFLSFQRAAVVPLSLLMADFHLFIVRERYYRFPMAIDPLTLSKNETRQTDKDNIKKRCFVILS